MIFTSHTCERCGIVFEREGRRFYQFCSTSCAGKRELKISAKVLAPYAEKGLRAGYICDELKVSRSTLTKTLRAHGLYKLWAQRRYVKCESPTAGSASARTVSGAMNSPSVASAQLMA